MGMTFSYYKLPTGIPERPWKYLPLVPLKVFSPERDAFVLGYGLVDSGAEKSLFDIEIAHELGIDLTSAATEVFSGIEEGKMEVYVTDVTVMVSGDTHITIPVGFTEQSSPFIVLGQEGFFDAYKITFNRSDFTFEFR